MQPQKNEALDGWGHSAILHCRSWRPESLRHLREILARPEGSVLARGMGRAYGDAALNPDVIRTERLDHILAFDEVSGIVQAQAGLILAELMDISIPRGWLPPVIPGTRHVTLGGAFACNVHGKNHFRDGDFAEHVLGIRLTLANGETIACTPEQYPEAFWATASGMGMTGIIEEVTLQLKPIASASLTTTTLRVDSIDDMIEAFVKYRDGADYMVGWIDHAARGESLGRGVFEAATHMPAGEDSWDLSEYESSEARFTIPFFAPRFLLNRHVMKLYNRLRFKKYDYAPKNEVAGFGGFFHPLDRLGKWNRLYGKRGFFQYQCILPDSPHIAEYLRDFLSSIQERRQLSFLAVLKYHREGKGLLTFPIRGYSIALDFPNTAKVRALIPELDRWVAERGGRVYLAKDALLSPEAFYQMYGDAAHHWRQLVHEIDPLGRFHSLMSERLQWKLHR